MEKGEKSSVVIGQPVRFRHWEQRLNGIVARIKGGMAFVLGENRQSYRLPVDKLQPLAQQPPVPHPESPVDSPPSPASLHVGETVAFGCRSQKLRGRIVRLNPKRAHVLCENNEEYAVPYGRIERLATEGCESGEKLAAIDKLACALLQEHCLTGWSFSFDHASRRAGCCDYRKKSISLALQFARKADEAEILDTLLHEIAHALVGKKHNHDAVWRAKALEIGGSGERCHDLCFTPPRYIVACRNGCWRATAERRRRNVVCRECKGEIFYQTYTEERWREGEAADEDQ